MFSLSYRTKDGPSRRETLERFVERTGKPHPDLIEPDVDPDALYLWGWYRELAARRDNTNGVKPIGWTEIDAWARRTGRDPEPWEVAVVTAIDDTYQAFIAERRKAERPTKAAPRKGK